MGARVFLVDVEATGPSPFGSVMTEFGVVDYLTRDWFHGHLWDSHPDPDIPALPVADRPNVWVDYSWADRENVQDRTGPGADPADALFEILNQWLNTVCGRDDRPVFMSDNPGFDFMWMAYGFDKAGMVNPFGHSSRRIGDLAAGLSGNWRNTSRWKRNRQTTHDHNPVNDSLGNAEALHTLLAKHQQHD